MVPRNRIVFRAISGGRYNDSHMENNLKGESPAVELQRMVPADIDAYLALEKRVESRTYTAAQNRQEAEEEFALGPMYFIKQGDSIVGAVSYSKKEDGSIYINGLSIVPEYQGRGLGRAALEKVLGQVKDAPRVWLVVHPENAPAVRLYESLGFTFIERIEDFHGDGEPRVVLSRDRSVG